MRATVQDWTSIEMAVAGLESDAVPAGSGESGVANAAVRVDDDDAAGSGVVAKCAAAG